ncbi:MAG: hypothetical protein K9H64_16650 [Bacteroidales bacterium]|nr:hypothetical protein [Bacteroidales bacterium]MCF8457601.1 hypothetical protein [Bacteroidales bacterium]
MRATRHIIIILVLFAIKVDGQDIIATKGYNPILLENVKGTDLEREIVSGSIQYELRLWICNFFFPDKLIQITKELDNNWDYRLGYFKYVDTLNTFSFQDSIIKPIDWKQFEVKLDSFKVAMVPNQDEIDLKLTKGGKTYEVKNEDFFSTIMDGAAYTVEIYDNETHKLIYYNNPHSYLENLIETGLPTKEHQDFIKFVDYLTENFDFIKLQRIQMKDLVDTKDKKKRKKNKQN